MALLRLFDPTTQFQTKSGALNVAGKLRIYIESTDDLANIYGDDGSLLSQPLILDSNGRARGLFVDSGRSYRLEVYDRNDSLLFTIRRLEPNASGTIINPTVFIKGTPDEIDVEDSVTEESRTYTVALSAKVTGEIDENREAIVKESEARKGADDELRKMIDSKQYEPGTESPLMDGKASVGNSLKYAREDHVHPTDTSREDIANKTAVVLGTSDSKYPTDKAVAEFVNSSIATNTANYISNNGEPFTSVEQLEAYTGTVTNNDYAFVTGIDSEGNTYYDRYKATVSGETVTWALEYRLNNSSFTAAQWSAINSGITSVLVAKIHDHSNKDVLDGITSTDVANWNGKMDRQTVGNVSEPVYLENGIAKVATNVATKTETEEAISNSVDQTYSPTSTKAQSGVAVNEAFKTRETSTSDDSYTYLGMNMRYVGTEELYWKLVSFNTVKNHWTLQFDIDVSNGRKSRGSYDTEIYETKRLTICGKTPGLVEHAKVLRYVAQGLDSTRGYNNNIYYEIGNSNLVTVYIKAIDKPNKTQLCRLKDVINFKNISNITWYEPVNDAGTQPTNPVNFKEVFPAIASPSSNIGSDSVPVYVNRGKPVSCNSSDLKAGKDDDGNVIKNTYQKKLTFDTTPTAGSTNPVTSGGIKTALNNYVGIYKGDSSNFHVKNNEYYSFICRTNISNWEKIQADFFCPDSDSSTVGKFNIFATLSTEDTSLHTPERVAEFGGIVWDYNYKGYNTIKYRIYVAKSGNYFYFYAKRNSSNDRSITAFRSCLLYTTNTSLTDNVSADLDDATWQTLSLVEMKNVYSSTTQERLDSHKNNTTVHITAAERTAWNAKQSALTFDTTPTAGSTNPVTSGGIKNAIDSAAGSATAKNFTGYNTSNIVTGSWYIIALKNGGASEWERLYEFLIGSNDNSAEQMRVLFSPRISANGGFDDSKVFISGHIIKNTSLLANWKFATLKDTAGTTYTALCVKGTNSTSSRSVYWNVRSVRGNNDWNPVSINLDTTTEYTIVSELPFNGANSLPNCITTDSISLNTSGNEFNASLPITSGAMFGYLTNNVCKPSKAITLSSGGANITQTGGSWTSTWRQNDCMLNGNGMLDVTADFGINIINQHTYVAKLTGGTCALCDWNGNVVASANFNMPKHIDNTLVYTVTDNVSLRFVVPACASNFNNGLKVVITLPSDYTIDDQVKISNFTLRGTYWRNGTGYNSNAIIYDS